MKCISYVIPILCSNLLVFCESPVNMCETKNGNVVISLAFRWQNSFIFLVLPNPRDPEDREFYRIVDFKWDGHQLKGRVQQIDSSLNFALMSSKTVYPIDYPNSGQQFVTIGKREVSLIGRAYPFL